MPTVVYTVTATLPDAATTERYVGWLTGGHVREVVVLGGALSATVSRLLDAPNRVESRYVFPDRAAYDRYVAEHAPKLREEGLRLFPPSSGVSMERRLAEVVSSL